MKPVHLIPENIVSRRRFLALSGLTIASTLLFPKNSAFGTTPPTALTAEMMPRKNGMFEIAPLPYDYGALEPWIDAETMHLHHDKHYAAYTNKLNDALAKFPAYQIQSIEELLSHISSLPESIRKAVRDNGGGYYNHSLFWRMIGPESSQPTGALANAIQKTFGTLDNFKHKFAGEAAAIFGSGWTWLVIKNDGSLEIGSTSNQDNPIMADIGGITGKPILGIDVWEHAYYLKYKNERAKYIESWWNIVNWDTVGQRFDEALLKT